MVSPYELLKELPPFTNNSILIEPRQGVPDIIKEVVNAHRHFASDYDGIGSYFNKSSLDETCNGLFDFCKRYIHYRVESEKNQTTKSPAAILEMGYGDCKHYAGFIAGVLDAITRTTGKKIDWSYRFASYKIFERSPQHVFVVVRDGSYEYWIDPVLGSYDERSMNPTYTVEKKVKINSMLHRVSGVGYMPEGGIIPEHYRTVPPDTNIEPVPEDNYTSNEISPVLEDNLKMLLYYRIIDENANIDERPLTELSEVLEPAEFEKLVDVYGQVMQQAGEVSGIFSTIWRGVKKVTLAVPRGAYLSLVVFNAFGIASKLWKAAFNEDGTYYEPGKAKLKSVWQDKLGGDWSVLENAIKKGRVKKRLLGVHDYNEIRGVHDYNEIRGVHDYNEIRGLSDALNQDYRLIGELSSVGVAPVPAAWAVTAAAIIAAITPIVSSILKQRQTEGYPITAEDMRPMPTESPLKQYLPYLLIAGAALAYLYFNKKRA